MKTFNTTQSDLIQFNGMLVSVLRQLEADEVDEEVGAMFEVRLPNGKVIQAFEDELAA